MLNVSGHRLSTIEIESALVAHPAVAEAAAVGRPHEIRGRSYRVFVTLTQGYEPSEELKQELKNWVREANRLPWQCRMTSALPRHCLRPAVARLCDGCSAISRPVGKSSKTPALWKITASWPDSGSRKE